MAARYLLALLGRLVVAALLLSWPVQAATAGAIPAAVGTTSAGPDGGKLQVLARWYFADGNSTAGYRTLISMLNPAAAPARVHMTFLYQAAPERSYLAIVPAHAHSTVDLAPAAGVGRHFSVILEADRHIGAQSITYYRSHMVGAAVGASATSTTWYLAEGYTGGLFREYLSIMNPNAGYATADVRFLPFNGRPPRVVRIVIHPRATILVDARRYMPRQSFSTEVTADRGVVVKRTMRFGRGGYAAHELSGSTSASTVWLFAQHQSALDRQTFLTVLNPSPALPAAVTATFMGPNGQPLGSRTIVVNPLHRGNIKLNDVLPQAEVATIVTSSLPVVVESSQYIGPARANLDFARSGSVELGSNGGSNTWIFSSVRTDHGYQAQMYVFNAGATAIQVMATDYTDRGIIHRQRLAVPPFAYGLLNLNALVGLPGGTSGVLLNGARGQIFVPEEVQYNTASQDVIDMQGIPS